MEPKRPQTVLDRVRGDLRPDPSALRLTRHETPFWGGGHNRKKVRGFLLRNQLLFWGYTDCPLRPLPDPQSPCDHPVHSVGKIFGGFSFRLLLLTPQTHTQPRPTGPFIEFTLNVVHPPSLQGLPPWLMYVRPDDDILVQLDHVTECLPGGGGCEWEKYAV